MKYSTPTNHLPQEAQLKVEILKSYGAIRNRRSCQKFLLLAWNEKQASISSDSNFIRLGSLLIDAHNPYCLFLAHVDEQNDPIENIFHAMDSLNIKGISDVHDEMFYYQSWRSMTILILHFRWIDKLFKFHSLAKNKVTFFTLARPWAPPMLCDNFSTVFSVKPN